MKKASYRKASNLIGLTFTSGDFYSAKEFVKELRGRKFNPKTKEWTVPFSMDMLKEIDAFGFELDDQLFEMIVPNVDESWREIELDPFYDFLRPYQKEVIQFMYHQGGRILNGDSAGLGKTIPSLAYMEFEQLYPALIVVPSALKFRWRDEFYKFFPDSDIRIKIVEGIKDVDDYQGEYDIVIMNYELVSLNTVKDTIKIENGPKDKTKTIFRSTENFKRFQNNGFKIMVVDESQRLSNPDSKITNGIKKLARKIDQLNFLSGTPMRNKTRGLFPVLNMLQQRMFPDQFNFLMTYCDPKKLPFGTTFDGATNTKKLNYLLNSHIMIRHLKKDVLKDLPPLSEVVMGVDLKDFKEYERIEQETYNELVNAGENATLGMFGRMRQVSFELKKQECFDTIDLKLESSDKVVVFAHHKAVIQEVMEKYGKEAVRLDGSMNSKQKEASKNKFINDPKIKVIAMNILAGGVGIDGLQDVASEVVFFELPWSKNDLEQAFSRLWRSGQGNPVTSTVITGNGTIDEDILAIIDRKAGDSSKVIDGTEMDEKDMLAALLKRFKRKMKRLERRRLKEAQQDNEKSVEEEGEATP